METSTGLPERPRRRRQWFSYSFRMFLLLTTMAVVLLGAWVNRAERQRRAVAAIRDAGGDVQYDFEWIIREPAPSGPFGLCEMLGVDYCADVAFVWMPRTTTDAGLLNLRTLAKLQFLDLSATQITDAGLVHLRALENLQDLYLWRTQITDAGLVHLRPLEDLQCLQLSGTSVTDAGLVQLSRLTNLQYLEVRETPVTDAGCDTAQKALPNCRISRFAKAEFAYASVAATGANALHRLRRAQLRSRHLRHVNAKGRSSVVPDSQGRQQQAAPEE